MPRCSPGCWRRVERGSRQAATTIGKRARTPSAAGSKGTVIARARGLGQVAPEGVARVAGIAGHVELRRQQLACAELHLHVDVGRAAAVGHGPDGAEAVAAVGVDRHAAEALERGIGAVAVAGVVVVATLVALPDLDLRAAQRPALPGRSRCPRPRPAGRCGSPACRSSAGRCPRPAAGAPGRTAPRSAKAWRFAPPEPARGRRARGRALRPARRRPCAGGRDRGRWSGHAWRYEPPGAREFHPPALSFATSGCACRASPAPRTSPWRRRRR